MKALTITVALSVIPFALPGLVAWWNERKDGQQAARRQHPSNGVTRERFDHDSQAIDVTRDIDVLMEDIESHLRNRQPRR